MVDETQETVTVPSASAQLANALATFALAVIANAKANNGVISEISADVAAALSDLAPAFNAVGAIGADVAADKVGVVEAFGIAGAQIARGLGA